MYTIALVQKDLGLCNKFAYETFSLWRPSSFMNKDKKIYKKVIAYRQATLQLIFMHLEIHTQAGNMSKCEISLYPGLENSWSLF